MEKLIGIKEASEILNLSLHTVRSYCSKGKLPIVRIGSGKQGRIRFKPSDLQTYIEEHSEKEILIRSNENGNN